MDFTDDTPRSQTPRPAFTLLELLIVVTILGAFTGIAIPKTRHLLDAIAVRAASDDTAIMLELARHVALASGQRVSVSIDSAPARLTMLAGTDTIRRRDEQIVHDVRFSASRPVVVYSQLGIGYGVSNLTLIVSRGSAAETLTVSRLGRVRR